MALSLSLNAAQTELTAVSDKRVHPGTPAVTENFKITVEASGETKIYQGVREVFPAVPGSTDPITVSDDSGKVWTKFSDDGVTAVFRIS